MGDRYVVMVRREDSRLMKIVANVSSRKEATEIASGYDDAIVRKVGKRKKKSKEEEETQSLPLKESFKKFYYHPFKFADNFNLTFKGNNLNLFQKYKRLQKSTLGIAVVCAVSWLIFGFDSTPLQFIHALLELPAVITGAQPIGHLVETYHLYYGREMHYSAFVIYGLMYYALSRHFEEEVGWKGAKNVAYAASLMLLSVAIFEFYWIYSFAYFQNQWWVATWKMPQLRILGQNLIFLAVGGAFTFYIWADSYIIDAKGKVTEKRWFKFNWNWKAVILFVVAFYFLFTWWFYPFSVEQISVELETGEIWLSSRNFPNTLYTIDLNPNDNINAGSWFYVQNDLIHAWNTAAKALFTFAIYYVGRVRKIG